MGKINIYKILAEKPERKRPVGTSTCRWDDNIRMDFKETMGVGWIHLVQDRDKWRAFLNR
jgi:hypothetical protein